MIMMSMQILKIASKIRDIIRRELCMIHIYDSNFKWWQLSSPGRERFDQRVGATYVYLVYANGRRETHPTWSQLNVNIKTKLVFQPLKRLHRKVPYSFS